MRVHAWEDTTTFADAPYRVERCYRCRAERRTRIERIASPVDFQLAAMGHPPPSEALVYVTHPWEWKFPNGVWAVSALAEDTICSLRKERRT